jgi:hypothetical protein
MLGFQNFDMTAWADFGLTHHVQQIKMFGASAVKKDVRIFVKKAANRFLFSVAAGAALTVSSGIAMANEVSSFTELVPGERVINRISMSAAVPAAADNAGELTPSYWAALSATMRTWKPVPEIEYYNPPSLF